MSIDDSDRAPPASVQPPVKRGTTVSAGFSVDEFDVTRLGSSGPAPFEISLFRVDPQCESIAESHEDAELWLVATGVGTMYHGERTLELGPGSVVTIEPGTMHRVVNVGSESLQIFSVWWMPTAWA